MEKWTVFIPEVEGSVPVLEAGRARPSGIRFGN